MGRRARALAARSCEAAFLEVAEALEEASQLPGLAARARAEAERAGEARRRMSETFAHLLTHGSAAAAT